MGFPARRVRGTDVRPAVRCQVDNGRVGPVELTGAGRFAIIPSDCLGRKDRNPGKPIPAPVGRVTLKTILPNRRSGHGEVPREQGNPSQRGSGVSASLGDGFLI